jgi:hypothetical protein
MKLVTIYPKVIILVVNLIILCFFECCARLLAYYGLIPFRYYPTAEQRVLADIDPHFGIWRHPKRSVEHTGACFAVKYSSNEFGMRDKERLKDVPDRHRLVVLGDSFVEGFGVEESVRLTDMAESRTGIEVLNFGISGDFSSTQEYLLYRELASQFEHSGVAIFFLPDNDFRDNNLENFSSSRYRPYLRKNPYGEYSVYYPVSFQERKQESGMSPFRSLRRQLYNRIYLLNAIRQFGDYFENTEIKDSLSDRVLQVRQSSYLQYTQEDIKKILWGYENIIRLAAPRPVDIFVIPRERDLLQARENEGIAEKLLADLRILTTKYDNVAVHDLIPHFSSGELYDEDKFFLPCDGHWSAEGHRVAADALIAEAITPLLREKEL